MSLLILGYGRGRFVQSSTRGVAPAYRVNPAEAPSSDPLLYQWLLTKEKHGRKKAFHISEPDLLSHRHSLNDLRYALVAPLKGRAAPMPPRSLHSPVRLQPFPEKGRDEGIVCSRSCDESNIVRSRIPRTTGPRPRSP
ncbi:hypothetical protein PIB30_106370 [Stylosanthes scabra]|uniref:Uncharacterized protein n=1 Tax=Stylosanthes scabra TaxID=79078 RepID=A0ABU6Z070_9FABA|nr:hypothetical protein [Stylosanthes scabra]